jgi:hypothetical protein
MTFCRTTKGAASLKLFGSSTYPYQCPLINKRTAIIEQQLLPPCRYNHPSSSSSFPSSSTPPPPPPSPSTSMPTSPLVPATPHQSASRAPSHSLHPVKLPPRIPSSSERHRSIRATCGSLQSAFSKHFPCSEVLFFNLILARARSSMGQVDAWIGLGGAAKEMGLVSSQRDAFICAKCDNFSLNYGVWSLILPL